MRAVVMAGGFGTRLRPLTEKLPKPMAYVGNRPMMEHVVRLLRRHGFSDLDMLLYFHPESISSHFGDGSAFGVTVNYLTAEADYGTAGAVKLDEARLVDTFMVISADIITDFDLSAAVAFHKERGAAATIVLTRSTNPLQYGIVMTDGEGRITRFLEKPSWGEVFTDTINTGIYILEPEVLSLIPEKEPFDFSKNLFPSLLSRGERLFGYVAEGYWKDVGNLNEYLNVQVDVLEGRVGIDLPGSPVGDRNVRIGAGTNVNYTAKLRNVLLGDRCTVGPGVTAENSAFGDGCVVEAGATVLSSVVWPDTRIGQGARVEEAIVGRGVEIRDGAHVEVRSVVADRCVIGSEAVVKANVKIWPHKTVEDGAVLSSSLIWGEKWSRSLFGAYGICGLGNLEISPEFAAKLGAAYGATFGRRVLLSTSRDPHRISRMINRAIMTGMLSVGVDVHDYGATPLPVVRFLSRTHREERGGVHSRRSPFDPAFVDIKFFDDNGMDIPLSLEKSVEQLFFREDFGRADFDETGEITFPGGAVDTYVDGFLKTVGTKAIRDRRFNIVLDYSCGTSSVIFPRILGHLGVDAVSLNASLDQGRLTRTAEEFERSQFHLTTIARSLNAHFGAMLDAGGEKVFLADERGDMVPDAVALQLVCLLACRQSRAGKVAVPVTASRNIEKIASRYGMETVRTRTLPRSLTAAAGADTVFLGDGDGGFVFPRFIPAFDGMYAVVKIMELLSAEDRPLSHLLREIPPTHLVRRQLPCPWEHKGALMRMAAAHARGKNVQFVDGVKFFEGEDWALLYPSQDEAYFHLFVEAEERCAAEALADRYAELFAGWSASL